jgi:hypothetical protein
VLAVTEEDVPVAGDKQPVVGRAVAASTDEFRPEELVRADLGKESVGAGELDVAGVTASNLQDKEVVSPVKDAL